ncbi:hypothetical protein EBZ80_02475 [bacterium]|nr:hypothetical protein [bacterium]
MKNCNPEDRKYRERPGDYVCNPATGKWVLRTGAVGKKILAGAGAPPAPPAAAGAAAKKTKTLENYVACNKDVTIQDLKAMLDAHGIVYKKKEIKEYYCGLVEQLIQARRAKIVGDIKKKAGSPARKAGSPARKAGSPPRKAGSPPRKAGSPPRKAGSPIFTDDVSKMSRDEIVRRIKECLKIR